VLAIGRKHQGNYDAQLQYKSGLTPSEAAQQFVADQKSTYLSNPAIKYWEGHNEPVWNLPTEMEWYAWFEVERIKLMADLGLKCVIGNFATGTPDIRLWAQFWPACKEGRKYEALLGLHEYSCPWMWWMTGNHQLDPNEDEGDEGWTTLRYRKIYRQYLIPNNAVIPLAITECGIDGLVRPLPPGAPSATWKGLGDYWREHDGETDKHDYYFRQLVWYDEELQKDDYVVGATIFTWGNYGVPWSAFDVAGTPVAAKLTAYTRERPAVDFKYLASTTPPPPAGRGEPRTQYERTYVLLPPSGDTALAATVVKQTWDQERWTVGGSADDAGIGDLDARRVIAIGPDGWPGDLAAFFTQHYPGVEYWPLEYDNDYQLKGRLLAYSLKEAGLELAYPTTHWPSFVTDIFGRWRGTYHHMGLDLRSSWGVWKDEVLSATDGVVTEAGLYNNAGGFGYRVRVRTQIADGRVVYLRYAHLVAGGIYVKVGDQVRVGQRLGKPDSTGTSTADHLHFDVKVGDEYADPALLLRWEQTPVLDPPPPPPPAFPLMGLHGQGGGDYLAAQGVKGWCVDPVYMNEDYQRLDYSNLASKGIRVGVNLRRGYSNDFPGGQGTVPPPDKWDRFVANAIQTIWDAKGVYAFTLFNEINNPREWPAEGYQVKAADVVYLYNEIYREVDDLPVKVGLGALDPFYGPGSNCMDWWEAILAGILGTEVIGLHGYTRGPNPAMVGSQAKFGDDPLRWQYLNYPGCVRTFIDAIPGRFVGAELLVTEINHLWLEDSLNPPSPTIGWHPDAVPVLEAFYQAVPRRVSALVAYRWSGDDWRLHDKPKLLQKIVALNR